MLLEAHPKHTALLEREATAQSLINQYDDLDLVSPDTIQALKASIDAVMSQSRQAMRDLELVSEEGSGEAEAQSNAGLITRHKATHEALQNALTAAAQRRRAALAASGASQRRELLGAASAQGLSAAAAAQRAAAASSRLATSQNVTQGLKRARQVLAEELQHTSATLAALDSSHGQLRGARDEYVGQAPLLKRSRRLLRTINWQSNLDNILLWTGVIIFGAVALYIVQKRVSYFVPGSLKPGNVLALLRHRAGAGRPGPGAQPLTQARLAEDPGPGMPTGLTDVNSIGRPAQQVIFSDGSAPLVKQAREQIQEPGLPAASPAEAREEVRRATQVGPAVQNPSLDRQAPTWQEHAEL
ncbi:SEC20 [Auxenochlorella protothecoides x Auxenochlorella symbiontica]